MWLHSELICHYKWYPGTSVISPPPDIASDWHFHVGYGTEDIFNIFTCWRKNVLFATSMFDLITITQYRALRKHIFTYFCNSLQSGKWPPPSLLINLLNMGFSAIFKISITLPHFHSLGVFRRFLFSGTFCIYTKKLRIWLAVCGLTMAVLSEN